MIRREFIIALGAAAAWPVAARAQQTLMPTIGFLSSKSPALFASHLRMFRQGLGEAGYVEGRNVTIEYRWAEGHNDRLPALATDLVRRHVNVIATPGTTPAALAAKAATTTIPIVFFTAGDPIALKLVASLNRPGGNATGATSLGGDLAPKRLELLHQLMPTATALAGLVNPSNPSLAESAAKTLQEAARTLGLQLHILSAAREGDFESVFTGLARRRARGLVIAIDSFFTARREQLGALALRHGIAAIYQDRDFAVAGGVISYGGSLREGYRVVGLYSGRILNGEKPADLPVQELTRIELIINAKAAQALGLSIPQTLLALADEVIE
jgi:putative tryptophan/tyrosine transport system substrate-binding protein